jgi:hypothetical protein
MIDPAQDDDKGVLLCPRCGFDLRGTQSVRCGECGLEIDREGLRHSGIPWVYRRRMGRVRSYLKTCWQVMADRPAIRFEAAKPQEPGDGRAFARVTGVIVALALLAVFWAVVYGMGGLTFLAVQPPNPLLSSGRLNPGADAYRQDFVVPWCAGATLSPVLPGCLISLGLFVAGAQRFVFRPRSMSAGQGARGLALSYYAGAPLVLMLPALVCGGLAGLLADRKIFTEAGRFRRLTIVLAIVSVVLYAGGALGTLYRVGQWVRRVRHCGTVRAWLGAMELIGLWVLGWLFFLGVVPWCVGFFWIVLDSLR